MDVATITLPPTLELTSSLSPTLKTFTLLSTLTANGTQGNYLLLISVQQAKYRKADNAKNPFYC